MMVSALVPLLSRGRGFGLKTLVLVCVDYSFWHGMM